MSQLRWLLVMESLPELEGNGRRYRLWLTALDEEGSYTPVPFDTVDDLFAALLARWDRRNQAANES